MAADPKACPPELAADAPIVPLSIEQAEHFKAKAQELAEL